MAAFALTSAIYFHYKVLINIYICIYIHNKNSRYCNFETFEWLRCITHLRKMRNEFRFLGTRQRCVLLLHLHMFVCVYTFVCYNSLQFNTHLQRNSKSSSHSSFLLNCRLYLQLHCISIGA